MSDLIDRQQAIEAICMETCGVSLRNERCMVHCTEVQTVEKLPPAPSANNSEFPNSSDTISRAKAIEALKNDMASLDHIIKSMSANDVRLDAYVSQRNQVDYDIYAIKQLLPAQPERIKGHWIKISPANIYECSECGKNVMTDDICAYDFCHGCGAKMESEVTE